jgi:alkylresorcinol/alkylpyrone synthase
MFKFNSEQPARIAAVATATPQCRVSQELADKLLTAHYAETLRPRSLDIMHQMLSHPSIRQRYVAVPTPADLVGLKNEDPDRRMDRFARWAVALSARSVAAALERAGIVAEDVSALVVNTCTGYLCPGISTYLIEECGLNPEIFAYDLVGAGCGGAVPALQVAQQMISGNPSGIAVSVSIEICTATFQMSDDISLIVSNAIFGDGAAAVVVWNRPEGVALIDTRSRYVPSFRDDVRYVYRRGQLHNQLSQRLPRIIGDVVPPFVGQLLSAHQLKASDIRHWAIHPGGDKMVQTIADKLALTDAQMAVTRGVLEEYGNMSSPTVLFEMERIMSSGMHAGEWGCIVAFGAGLSAHACLVRA